MLGDEHSVGPERVTPRDRTATSSTAEEEAHRQEAAVWPKDSTVHTGTVAANLQRQSRQAGEQDPEGKAGPGE